MQYMGLFKGQGLGLFSTQNSKARMPYFIIMFHQRFIFSYKHHQAIGNEPLALAGPSTGAMINLSLMVLSWG